MRCNIPVLCRLNLLDNVGRKGCRVDIHGVAVGRRGDIDSSEGFTSFVALLGQTTNHANGCILLIQSVAELLPGLRKVLLQLMRLKRQ